MNLQKRNAKTPKKETTFQDDIAKIPDRKSCDRIRSFVNKKLVKEVSDYFSTETSDTVARNSKQPPKTAARNNRIMTEAGHFDQQNRKKLSISVDIGRMSQNHQPRQKELCEEREISGKFMKTIMTKVKKHNFAEKTKEEKLNYIDQLFQMRMAKNILGEKAFCEPSTVIKDLSFEEYQRRRYKVLKSSNLPFCRDNALVERNTAYSKYSQEARNPSRDMPHIWFTMRADIGKGRRGATVVQEKTEGKPPEKKPNLLDAEKLKAIARMAVARPKVVMESESSATSSPRSILNMQAEEVVQEKKDDGIVRVSEATSSDNIEERDEGEKHAEEGEKKRPAFLITESHVEQDEQKQSSEALEKTAQIEQIEEAPVEGSIDDESNPREENPIPNSPTNFANEIQIADVILPQHSEIASSEQNDSQRCRINIAEGTPISQSTQLKQEMEEDEVIISKEKSPVSNASNISVIALRKRNEGLKKQLSFLENHDISQNTAMKDPRASVTDDSKADSRTSMELPPIRQKYSHPKPQASSVRTSSVFPTGRIPTSPDKVTSRNATPTPNNKREVLLNNRMRYQMLTESSFDERTKRFDVSPKSKYKRDTSFTTTRTAAPSASPVNQSFSNLKQMFDDLKPNKSGVLSGYLGTTNRTQSVDLRKNSKTKTKKEAIELMALYNKYIPQFDQKKEKEEEEQEAPPLEYTVKDPAHYMRFVTKARRKVLVKDLKSHQNRLFNLKKLIL